MTSDISGIGLDPNGWSIVVFWNNARPVAACLLELLVGEVEAVDGRSKSERLAFALSCFPAKNARGALMQAAAALTIFELSEEQDVQYRGDGYTANSPDRALWRLLISIRNYLDTQSDQSLMDMDLPSLRERWRDPWLSVEEQLEAVGEKLVA
ncbi:MAG: hypothetical protein ROR55_17230 [Devosia sp.]